MRPRELSLPSFHYRVLHFIGPFGLVSLLTKKSSRALEAALDDLFRGLNRQPTPEEIYAWEEKV